MKTFAELTAGIDITGGQVAELEAAYAQTVEGFELILARSQGGTNPTGYLLSLIREGAHLRVTGQRDEPNKGLFTCKFCGPLGNTNTSVHYENFPEHRQGRSIPELTYATPPPRKKRR